METLDTNNMQPPTQTLQQDKITAAREALRRLKERKDQKERQIKPKAGFRRKLWYDISKYDTEERPDQFQEPTEDNPHPTRDVYIFTVKTEEGYQKDIELTPNRAQTVMEILVERGGSAWVVTTVDASENGKGTKWNFIAV
jgi:hypothetical protein